MSQNESCTISLRCVIQLLVYESRLSEAVGAYVVYAIVNELECNDSPGVCIVFPRRISFSLVRNVVFL